VLAVRVEQRKRTLVARIELALMIEARHQFIGAFAHEGRAFAQQPVVDALDLEARDLDVEVSKQQKRDDTEHREK
jgi:hypothetical protein